MLASSFLGLGLVVLANFFYQQIVQEVNAALSSDQRISPWRAGLGSSRLFERHRELLPESLKRSVATWLSGLGVMFLLGAMAIGFLVRQPITNEFRLLQPTHLINN